MKKKLIAFIIAFIIIILGILAINYAQYDASQSQCEHYQDAKRQQENIQNGLED